MLLGCTPLQHYRQASPSTDSDDEIDLVPSGHIIGKNELTPPQVETSQKTVGTAGEHMRILNFSAIHILEDHNPIQESTPSMSMSKVVIIACIVDYTQNGSESRRNEPLRSGKCYPDQVLQERARVFLDLTEVNPLRHGTIENDLRRSCSPRSELYKRSAERSRLGNYTYCFKCGSGKHGMGDCVALRAITHEKKRMRV